MKAQTVYYTFCSIVTGIAVSLFYWINTKMVYKNKKVGTKRFWYIVHVFALSLVTCSQFVFSFTQNPSYAYIIYNTTYGVTLVLICVIVWYKATEPEQTKFELIHYDDGSVELKFKSESAFEETLSI